MTPSFVLVLLLSFFVPHTKTKNTHSLFWKKRTQFKFILYHFYSIFIKNVKCQTNDKNEKRRRKRQNNNNNNNNNNKKKSLLAAVDNNNANNNDSKMEEEEEEPQRFGSKAFFASSSSKNGGGGGPISILAADGKRYQLDDATNEYFVEIENALGAFDEKKKEERRGDDVGEEKRTTTTTDGRDGNVSKQRVRRRGW